MVQSLSVEAIWKEIELQRQMLIFMLRAGSIRALLALLKERIEDLRDKIEELTNSPVETDEVKESEEVAESEFVNLTPSL